MKNTPNPDPKEILDQHRSTFLLIVQALQKGTRHAQTYADWQDEPIDKYLAPALVRKEAKRFLTKEGQRADEEQVEWESENLANLGLALNVEGVKIRILKSDHGNLPIPGPSTIRQQFYSQQGTFWDLKKDEPPPEDGAVINLVVHWATDDEYSLDKVSFAAPKSGDTTRNSVQKYFDEPIWRRRRPETFGQQAEAEITDLDIHLDSEEDTGTRE